MKKILGLCLVFLIYSANATANVKDDQEEMCLEAMAMAQAAMSVRQDGLPLHEALQNINQLYRDDGISKREYDLVKMILRDAYSKPKFSTKEYQNEAVNEYSSKYYLACMESFELLNKN